MSALIQHPDEGKDWITTFLVNEKKTDENRGGWGVAQRGLLLGTNGYATPGRRKSHPTNGSGRI